MPKGRRVPPAKEREEMTKADKRILRAHAAEYWRAAHGYYQEYGRGALLVDYRQVVDGTFRTLYVALENEIGWSSPDARRAVETYDPEAEFIVILIGRSGDPTNDTWRWHRRRYRNMAA